MACCLKGGVDEVACHSQRCEPRPPSLQLCRSALVTDHCCDLGLVWGRVKEGFGRIEGLLGRHPKDRTKMAVVRSGGRRSATKYEIAQTADFLTLLDVFLETGRTHQIRVHMDHIGHPIFADEVYGGGAQKIKGIAPQFREKASGLLRSAGRQMLHAADLGFLHPASGEAMQLRAPPPADIQGVLSDLGMTSGD